MNGIRNKFKTPEGAYQLLSERACSIGFNYQRSTRLAVAHLYGGAEEGQWILYTVGESLLVSRAAAMHKDPTRALLVGNSAVRMGLPTCLDFAAAKDGIDTLVGLGDGQVLLLPLRAQLQAAPNAKPAITSTLAPEATNEAARCVAVVWLPRTDGLFAAAFASGSIYIFKKSTIMGDASASKFSLGLGSGSKGSTVPNATHSISGGGINDLAASPCGTRVAAACRDGAVRLVDVATGTVIGGFQSYYGAMLCCTFSHDGRYLAAGGEDDLVTVYSVAERYLVAHCQGHDSWVSRVAFDAWMEPMPPLGGGPGSGGAASTVAGPGSGDGSGIYRLASVGQDAQLCLWDVQILPLEGDLFATPVTGMGTMRKSSSQASLTTAGHTRGGSGEGSAMPGSTHKRNPSVSKATPGGGITPSLPHDEMNVVQPIMQLVRVHPEPLSDVAFTDTHILTADHGASVRVWARPGPGPRLSAQRHALIVNATSGHLNGPTPMLQE